MAWHQVGDKPFLSLWWSSSVMSYGTTVPQWVNSWQNVVYTCQGTVLLLGEEMPMHYLEQYWLIVTGGDWYVTVKQSSIFADNWPNRNRKITNHENSFLWKPNISNVIADRWTERRSKERMEHDDVIKWKHFPRNWPFVRGIHRSRWIPHTKASDAELWCFIWSASG